MWRAWNLWAEVEGGGSWRKDTGGGGRRILRAWAAFMVIYMTHKCDQDDGGVPPRRSYQDRSQYGL